MGKLATIVVLTKKPSTSISGGSSRGCTLANKEIQQKLNKFGYKFYADGDFGRLTYNAVIDFQMRNKILKDGIVGKATLKKPYEIIYTSV